MNKTGRYLLRLLGRVSYTGGVIMLLAGTLLSLVQTTAYADNPPGRQLPGDAGRQISLPTQPSSGDPGSSDTPPLLNPKDALQPEVRNQAPRGPSGNSASAQQPGRQLAQRQALSPAVVIQVQPDDPPFVVFDDPDYSICQFDPIDITVTGTYHLQPGQSAYIQWHFYVVQPGPPPSSFDYFYIGPVQGDGTFSVTGRWPGIQPGNTGVEIHYGAALIDQITGNPLGANDGLDIYWYPWVCTASPTPTNTPTFTATPTETSTPTFTATPTETSTPTFTATPTETSTPTFTATPTETSTPTLTTTVSVTPTATTTTTATPTRPTPPGNDPSPTPTRPTPPGNQPSRTPTSTSNATPTLTSTPDGGVIIPVTGADLINPSLVSGWLINLGLFFLGVGLVITALSRRNSTR